jgi:hypothetical protein
VLRRQLPPPARRAFEFDAQGAISAITALRPFAARGRARANILGVLSLQIEI